MFLIHFSVNTGIHQRQYCNPLSVPVFWATRLPAEPNQSTVIKSREGRPRVMFICDQQLKDDLEAWATDEGRTVSNLMERIAIAAVQDYKNGVLTTSPNPNPQTRRDQLMPKIDRDLIKVAAKTSNSTQEEFKSLEELIPALSEAERNEFLVKVLRGEPVIGVQLAKRLKELSHSQIALVPGDTKLRLV